MTPKLIGRYQWFITETDRDAVPIFSSQASSSKCHSFRGKQSCTALRRRAVRVRVRRQGLMVWWPGGRAGEQRPTSIRPATGRFRSWSWH